MEVGTRFRSDINGYITGIRFYKAAANTGTHTGRLWTNTGALLATVTFTNETASGWQQMALPNAVPITANTTYVVSYHAPNGHYTGTDNFLRERSRPSAAARPARRRRRIERRVPLRSWRCLPHRDLLL